ncbi:MAG: cell division protein FtsL [bacterium]|nr:cell division protein FtsL [bacterium]
MRRSYAVVRPVSNTYLIRERDRRRRRELLWVASVLLPLGACALVYVWLHVEVLRVGYRIHDLEKRVEQQVELERRLGLEASFLESPKRIEERAIAELGMSPPAAEQLIFAEVAR